MPLVHGIDLVDMDQFRLALGRNGQKFLSRLFTQEEQNYCHQRQDPAPSLAARFALKEAVSKALGTGIGKDASFLEIEVLSDPTTGKPQLQLHGQTAQTAQNLGITQWSISLTHTHLGAIGSVVGQ